MRIHLDTPRSPEPLCGATGETAPDINLVTCPKCLRKHDAIMERQERRWAAEDAHPH